MPGQKLIDFPENIVISSVYQYHADDTKDWRWSMKASKAVNLFLDYHRLNSQKKYEPF